MPAHSRGGGGGVVSAGACLVTGPLRGLGAHPGVGLTRAPSVLLRSCVRMLRSCQNTHEYTTHNHNNTQIGRHEDSLRSCLRAVDMPLTGRDRLPGTDTNTLMHTQRYTNARTNRSIATRTPCAPACARSMHSTGCLAPPATPSGLLSRRARWVYTQLFCLCATGWACLRPAVTTARFHMFGSGRRQRARAAD